MKDYSKTPETATRNISREPQASKQASMADYLATQRKEILQRKALEEDELLQGKFEPAQREEIEDEEPLQGKFETAQREEKPNNTGLPDNLKAGIENLSGYSMDDVKVHYNSDKPAQLQALAYAQGTDIHVAPGQEKHLPHEAWHVVQQKQGRVKSTLQMQDNVNINDDSKLENESDLMGMKALKLDILKNNSLQLKTISTSIVQRTVWTWDGNHWMPIRTVGMPTGRPLIVGKYCGERISTGSEELYEKEHTIDKTEVEEVKGHSVKVPNQEYIGGAKDESHIHKYKGGFHLKLGGNRYNIIQKGTLYNDALERALEALREINGDRAEWAGQIIAYIKEMSTWRWQ